MEDLKRKSYLEYMKQNEMSLLLGHLAMLLFSLLVSLSFVLGVLVANDINPIAITGARFILAALAILGIIYVSKAKSFYENWVLFKNPKNYIILSLLISVYFITMFEGLKTAGSISMSAVFTLTPLLTGLSAHFLGYQRLRRKVFFAVLLGAIGSLWIIFEGSSQNLLSLNIGKGELIFFVGCFCHALYAVFIPVLNRGESSIIQTSGVLIFSSIIVCLFGVKPMTETNWLNLSSLVILTIFYLAIFATAITFFLIQFSARRISGTKVMSYTYAIPFWVALSGGLLLGRWPTAETMLGGILIAAALIFLMRDDLGNS